MTNWTIYDTSRASSELIELVKIADNHGFKRAQSFGRRTGGSLARNALSEYEYVNTRQIIHTPPLMRQIKEVAKKLNLYDHMLVHYILQLQPDDFLDLQDYWQEGSGLHAAKSNNGHGRVWYTGKFFSIAVTPDNIVNIEDEDVSVPQYHAIEFHPKILHSVPKVNKKTTWMVFMVPVHLDLSSILNTE
jgi:hypothetical protein